MHEWAAINKFVLNTFLLLYINIHKNKTSVRQLLIHLSQGSFAWSLDND